MTSRLSNELTKETKFKADLLKTGYIIKETNKNATLETYCATFEDLQQNVFLDLTDYKELEYLKIDCKNFSLSIEKV